MIGTDVQKAAALLSAGKLVAIPTETVYGLSAKATDSEAVMSIFNAKKRPFFDPLIIHIHSFDQLAELTTEFPPKAQKLAEVFWPGPLTLILPKSDLVPDITTSGLQFVGIRMPSHPMTRLLLQNLDFPLAAPSANPFGYVSPTTAQHVEKQLGEEVDYILDGGDSAVGVESTIVSFINPDKPAILRYGGIALEQIESLIGALDIQISVGSKPDAPGQLDKHYATSKPLHLVAEGGKLNPTILNDCYVIGFGEVNQHKVDFNLSITGDLEEASRNLFKALRLADDSDYKYVAASMVPETGLGRAINDRLRRAAFV